MPERHIVANLSPDPKNPSLTLARVFSRRMPGTLIREQPPMEDNLYQGSLNLEADEDQKDTVQSIWETIISTKDFLYLKMSCEGNPAFFRDNFISPDDFIISSDEGSFMRFNRFLIEYAYHRAIEQAHLLEDFTQVKELKLNARQAWVPEFSRLKRKLAPYYIQSVVERLHNLVTTGEERKTFKDRVLDWMLG